MTCASGRFQKVASDKLGHGALLIIDLSLRKILSELELISVWLV